MVPPDGGQKIVDSAMRVTFNKLPEPAAPLWLSRVQKYISNAVALRGVAMHNVSNTTEGAGAVARREKCLV